MLEKLLGNRKEYAVLIKSSFWYVFSTFLLNGISFIVTPIFTRAMTVDEFGVYNNYASWQSIFNVFITLNLSVTLASAYTDYKENIKKYCYSMTVLMGILTIIWAIAFYVLAGLIEGWTLLGFKYTIMIVCYSFGMSLLSMYQTLQRYEYRYKKSTVISVAVALCNTVLSLILVFSLTDKAYGRVLGITLPTFICGLIFLLYFTKGQSGYSTSHWRYAVPLALPYIPHLLSMTLLNSIDRTMITRYCGSDKTAIYSVAYTCGSIVIIVLQAVNTAYSPWLREQIEKDNHKTVRKTSYIYIALGVGICLMVIMLAPEIIAIYGGKKYADSVYVLPPIATGCFLQFMYTMFVNIEQIQKKTKDMAIASCTAAAVNVVLNYIFIPRLGYLAAAYTTVIGYLVLLAIHMHVVRKIKMNHYYNYSFIIGLAAFMVIASFLFSAIYSYPVARYVLIVVIMAVMVAFALKYKNRVTSFN